MLVTTPRSPKNRKRGFYVFTLFLVLYLICTEIALLSYDEEPLNVVAMPTERTLSLQPESSSLGRETRTLLVSALFPLEKSKHSKEDYDLWLSKFLGSITTPVYFYTTPSLAATVLSKRGLLPIHVNTSFASPFGIPPLKGLEGVYNHMHKLDREASLHNPELYAVWNAKPWLLDNAVQQSKREGKEYDCAFWNDAGSFRVDHQYTRWPDPTRVDEVWQEALAHVRAAGDAETRKEDMLFFPLTGTFSWLSRYWKQDDGRIDAEISEGSFFGGSPASISWWSKVYYTYHDYYLNNGHFVGKDQTLINSLFLLYPSRIFGVWLADPATRTGVPHFDVGPMGSCGNTWFYYQFFLASHGEQQEMRERWMKDLQSWTGKPWKEWWWWLKRQECHLTRVVWMKDMLNEAFGKGWGVRKTVDIQ